MPVFTAASARLSAREDAGGEHVKTKRPIGWITDRA